MVRNQPVKFGSYRDCGNGDEMVLIRHVISKDQ